MHIDDVSHKFEVFLRNRVGISSANSLRLYIGRLRIFLEWLSEINDIDRDTTDEFLNQISTTGWKRPNGKTIHCKKNNAINSYIIMLQHWCRFIVHHEIPGHPYIKNEYKCRKKNTTPTFTLTAEEEAKILSVTIAYRYKTAKYLDQTYRALTRFLLMTGCRFSEAADLLWKWVDLDSGAVIFVDTKNGDWRKVFIKDPLISELKALKRNSQSGLVFTNTRNKKIHAQDYSKDLKLRCKKAGITKRVHPHLFRHSLATILHKEGGQDIKTIKEVLGHKDIKSTDGYIHADEEEIEQALMTHPLNLEQSSVVQLIKEVKTIIEKLPHLKTSKLYATFTPSKMGDKLTVVIAGR